MKPTRFVVEYEDEEKVARVNAVYGSSGDADPTLYMAYADFNDIAAAQTFLAGKCGQITERYDIEDVTPEGDPPGLIWEYRMRCAQDWTSADGSAGTLVR